MSKPRILVVVAGLPKAILGSFINQLKTSDSGLDVLKTLPLDSTSYTAQYAERLYGLMASGLRKIPNAGCGTWEGISLVVLYSLKPDGSEHHVVERFDMEALLAPLVMEPKEGKAPKKIIESNIVNNLLPQSKLMLNQVRKILAILANEMTGRDSRTCVLLPRVNFGNGFDEVKDCVHRAVANHDLEGEFETQLKRIADDLPKKRGARKHSRKRFYFTSGGLVFEAPSKAGPRHGMAPSWDTGEHNDRCVIQGHFRFGVPYDPKFHYDCKLPRRNNKDFTSCHGIARLKIGRNHVNIAPNDNIR